METRSLLSAYNKGYGVIHEQDDDGYFEKKVEEGDHAFDIITVLEPPKKGIHPTQPNIEYCLKRSIEELSQYKMLRKNSESGFTIITPNAPHAVMTKKGKKREAELAYTTFVGVIESLYRYGAPALHIDNYVENLRQALQIGSVSITLTPGGIWFYRHRRGEYIPIRKSTNINKLTETVKIVRAIAAGSISKENICEALETIAYSKPVYNRFLKFLIFPLYAIGFTVFFFNGNINSIWVSACIGVIIGVYNYIGSFNFFRAISRLEIFISCLVIGLIVGGFTSNGFLSQGCGQAASFGAAAIYFPGVTASFSVLEMMQEYVNLGAVRFAYAQFMSQVVASGISFGTAFWFTVVFPGKSLVTAECIGLIHTSVFLRIPFYVFLYFPAVIFYEIPLKLMPPFLIVQATTYFVYFVIEHNTRLGGYFATIFAVFVMVLLSGFFSHPGIRRYMFPSMNSMATVIPTLELLVPGASMISYVLALVSGEGGVTQTVALTFTTISISVGFILGDAALKLLIPSGGKGIMQVPIYRGPLNNVPIDRAYNEKKAISLLPDGCTEYLIIILHSAKNLVPADIKGFSDPFIQLIVDKRVVARTSIKSTTLNPVWEEAFILPIITDQNGDLCFEMQIKDYDLLKADDLIGRLQGKISVEKQTLYINEIKVLDFEYQENLDPVQHTIKLQDAISGTVSLSFAYNTLEEFSNNGRNSIADDDSQDSGDDTLSTLSCNLDHCDADSSMDTSDDRFFDDDDNDDDESDMEFYIHTDQAHQQQSGESSSTKTPLALLTKIKKDDACLFEISDDQLFPDEKEEGRDTMTSLSNQKTCSSGKYPPKKKKSRNLISASSTKSGGGGGTKIGKSSAVSRVQTRLTRTRSDDDRFGAFLSLFG